MTLLDGARNHGSRRGSTASTSRWCTIPDLERDVRRLRRWFPDADLVVFGHSHIPMELSEEGIGLLNPGSPTWKRRQDAPTFAVVKLRERAIDVRIVEVP